MSGMRYSYPVRLEADEIGRLVVHFPDLPEALTDGADEEEALAEASDCLSEALAGRIHRQEDIPIPSPLRRGMYAVEPKPTIALKAGLYAALTGRGMRTAGLAQRLGIDERQAARLLDPKARTPLAKLEAALSALGSARRIDYLRERRLPARVGPAYPHDMDDVVRDVRRLHRERAAKVRSALLNDLVRYADVAPMLGSDRHRGGERRGSLR